MTAEQRLEVNSPTTRRADCAQHSESSLDVLRRGRESARDPDESQQRARVCGEWPTRWSPAGLSK